MTFPVSAPDAGHVTDPSLVPLIGSGPTFTPPEAAFVKVVLHRPIRRAAAPLRPVPPPRVRAKSVKRSQAPEPPKAPVRRRRAPEPPKASVHAPPARPPSPTEASKAAWRQVVAEVKASTSDASALLPGRPMEELQDRAPARARADASRTRFGRFRDRVADAVPAPLHRAWRAVISRLRSCVGSPQA